MTSNEWRLEPHAHLSLLDIYAFLLRRGDESGGLVWGGPLYPSMSVWASSN